MHKVTRGAGRISQVMKSPFVFDVAALLRGSGIPENIQQSGPSPTRIGPAMIAIPEGGTVDVDAHFIPLGGGISVQATIQAQLLGQCSRCLRELTPHTSLNVSEVFAVDDDFITGEDAEDEDELPQVHQDSVDLLQSVIDAAGLNLPFNPLCTELGFDSCDDSDVPAPDGTVDAESRTEDGDDPVDPRWAGLEKFL